MLISGAVSVRGDSQANLVTIGWISGVLGVRGWVKVYSYTVPKENILDYSPWYVSREKESPQQLQLLQGKRHGKGIIAQLETIDNRDMAASLFDMKIAVPRSVLPETEPNQYYWTDLEGLQVITIAGHNLGYIDHLLETGANDVLVVQGERERLIPFLQGQVVTKVDLQNGRLYVDWDADF